MTSRTKKILIVIIILLVVLLALWLIFRRKPAAPAAPAPAPTPAPSGSLTSAPAVPVVPVNPLSPPPVPRVVEIRTTSALQIADLFAVRYDSYSNQETSYQNLRDLLPIMSDRYRAQTEAKITAAPTAPPAAQYQGFTAAKISSKLISDPKATDTATAQVVLQETKTVGNGTPQVSYRTLQLELVKSGKDWRVDSVHWAT